MGSAREIARLTEAHDAYRWLCGGVQVNHHTVSDFRKGYGEALDELLSVSIASLMAAGVVKLKQVAQDGIRVRASAGAGSFRRKEKLEGYLEAARSEVARLKAELEADPAAAERARTAAKARAAKEREVRLEEALARLPEIEAIKQRQGKKPEQARASMTDADATVMKMGDGGFRPAYNPQLASDADSLVIVGVDVATVGSDQGQMGPMVEQVAERCGRAPDAWLVDGGYVGHEQIDQASRSTVVYGPVPEPKDKTVDPHRAKPNDSEAAIAPAESRARSPTGPRRLRPPGCRRRNASGLVAQRTTTPSAPGVLPTAATPGRSPGIPSAFGSVAALALASCSSFPPRNQIILHYTIRICRVGKVWRENFHRLSVGTAGRGQVKL